MTTARSGLLGVQVLAEDRLHSSMAKAFVIVVASVTLVVLMVSRAAGAANATKGWHRCDPLSGYGPASLCDGRGRVLFPRLLARYNSAGYTQVVTGFRRSSSRRAIVDTYADWYLFQGECGQNGVIRDCKNWAAREQIRYQTSDGGRRWRPMRFHREATRGEGPGPDPPVQTGHVDDHPPLKPCKWSHAYRDELVDWLGDFGNWCAPADEWKIPDSLKPGAG